MRRNAGMSLIELMVALSIGTVVIAAVLGVLASARRTQLIGERRSEVFQSVRVSLNQLEKDLKLAILLDEDEKFQFVGTDEMLGDLPMDSIEFATASGAPMSSLLPTGDLVRVMYYIDIDETTGRDGLVRCAMPMPLPDEVAPEQQDMATREYCPWALGLDTLYYDPTEEAWVEDWQERTDLPSAVQLVVYVLPEETDEEAEPDYQDMMPFSTTVHLLLNSAPVGTGQVSESDDEGQGPGGGQGPAELDEEAPGPGEIPMPNIPGLPTGGGGIPGLPTGGMGGGR